MVVFAVGIYTSLMSLMRRFMKYTLWIVTNVPPAFDKQKKRGGGGGVRG